jgi:hypothetical protein
VRARPKSITTSCELRVVVPAVAQHDVVALEVAVDDAAVVRRTQSEQLQPCDAQRFVEIEERALEQLAQREPVDELHREKMDGAGVARDGVVFPDVEHAAHVRVPDGAGELHLGLELAHGARAVAGSGDDRLQRDAGFQHRVKRFVDLAHAAALDEARDAETPGGHRAGAERRGMRGGVVVVCRVGFPVRHYFGDPALAGLTAVEVLVDAGQVLLRDLSGVA